MGLYLSILATIFSAPLFAQTCYVRLADNFSTYRTFQASADASGRCREAMRECSRYRRQNNLMHARCEQVGGNPNTNIQVGQTVFPDGWNHDRGATVLRVNRDNTLTIRSNSSFNNYTVGINEVSLGQGCIATNACVRDLVHPKDFNHGSGAVIFAVKKSAKTALMKSNSSGSIYQKHLNDLFISSGCMDGICVGSRVYPRNWNHNLGARVLGISRRDRTYFISSNSSGSVYTVRINDL